MEPTELRRFTTAKRFISTFAYQGSTFELEVETPDLAGARHSMWGDWGPMYTFAFDEPRAVRIAYRCEALSIVEESHLLVPKMHLESPMLHAKRQLHPLFVRFRHPALGLEFEGYLDERGEPAALEVKQICLGAGGAQLLLIQPPPTPGWHPAAEDRKVA